MKSIWHIISFNFFIAVPAYMAIYLDNQGHSWAAWIVMFYLIYFGIVFYKMGCKARDAEAKNEASPGKQQHRSDI